MDDHPPRAAPGATPLGPHLGIDELNLQVELASLWQYDQDVWHQYANPGHHLLLVVSGTVRAVSDQERFTATAGDLIIFRPSRFNQYGTQGPTRLFQIHLQLAPPPRHLLPLAIDGIGTLPTRLALGPRRGRAIELFEAMCLAIEAPEPSARLRLRAAAEELLALAIDAAAGRARSRVAVDPWQMVRQRLDSRLEQDLPIARLAKEVGLSPDHFIRRFRQRFGVSPKRYRTLARLRWAAQQLRLGSQPIKAIARAIGCSDPTAFTRLFRRHFGIPPSAMLHGVREGEPLPPEPLASRRGALPMNRHLVAPTIDPNWQDKFRPSPDRR